MHIGPCRILKDFDRAMNIYDIVSGCEEEHASEEDELAGVAVRKLFASVTFQPKDEMWLVRELQGKPFSKPWRTLELRFDKPELPHADFPEFDYPSLVCNERAMAAVGDVLRETGELFPVKLRGDKGTYQLHNIPSMKAKLLDAKKTTWRMIAGEKCLHVPAFLGNRIGSFQHFRECARKKGTILDIHLAIMTFRHDLKRFPFAAHEPQTHEPISRRFDSGGDKRV